MHKDDILSFIGLKEYKHLSGKELFIVFCYGDSKRVPYEVISIMLKSLDISDWGADEAFRCKIIAEVGEVKYKDLLVKHIPDFMKVLVDAGVKRYAVDSDENFLRYFNAWVNIIATIKRQEFLDLQEGVEEVPLGYEKETAEQFREMIRKVSPDKEGLAIHIRPSKKGLK